MRMRKRERKRKRKLDPGRRHSGGVGWSRSGARQAPSQHQAAVRAAQRLTQSEAGRHAAMHSCALRRLRRAVRVRAANPNPIPIPRAARAHCTLSDDVVWRGSSISPRTRSHPETETESRESRVWRVASDSGIIRKEKESLSKSPIESGAERPRSRSRSSTVNHQKPLHNTE